jgi:molybdate transport system ATP-binding protein
MISLDIRKRIYSSEQLALDLQISLTLEQGITILVGPSGAGKTTVLRAVAGIVTPDEGKIVVGDRTYFNSVTKENLSVQERHVGYLFQEYALFPHMTAEENVTYAIKGKGRRERREKSIELLASLGIEYAANRYPYQLSGGEKQRVAFARALATDPAILLLDEPLSAIDIETRGQMLGQIETLHEQTKIPFLYVTHNHAEAKRLGTHVVLLNEGKVIEQGRPEDILCQRI